MTAWSWMGPWQNSADLGRLEDIYRYPANWTVAAFGTPNLLEASRVARGRKRRFWLEVVGRGWRGPCEAVLRAARPVADGHGAAGGCLLKPAGLRKLAQMNWTWPDESRTRSSAGRSDRSSHRRCRLNVDVPLFGSSHAAGDNVTVVVLQRPGRWSKGGGRRWPLRDNRAVPSPVSAVDLLFGEAEHLVCMRSGSPSF